MPQNHNMSRIILALIVAATIVGCGGTTEEKGDKKLNIITTTGMIADAIENITGDKATVIALMGPGIDPHLYKASQGDLTKLREADIIFYNGLHLEGKMQEIFDQLSKERAVFAISASIDEKKLRNIAQVSGISSHDPHLWFDVMLWSECVEEIGKKLSETDKKNAALYQENTKIYLEKLKKLDEEVRNKISSIPPANRILITSHDAFGYFGRAYGIEVKGLQGISTAAEFGLKDITDMVNMVIELKVKAVFVESSVSEKSINAVREGCEQKGHNLKSGGTLFSDAMGAKNTPKGNYIGMVQHNTNIIYEALK